MGQRSLAKIYPVMFQVYVIALSKANLLGLSKDQKNLGIQSSQENQGSSECSATQVFSEAASPKILVEEDVGRREIERLRRPTCCAAAENHVKTNGFQVSSPKTGFLG